jgi:hypothetical protein
MANKKRRNKKIRRQQVAAAASRQPQVEAGASSPSDPGPVTGATAERGSATAPRTPIRPSVTGPRARAQAAPATTIDIESRVPYFASDLRRIALTAGVLVAVIVGASFFIH